MNSNSSLNSISLFGLNWSDLANRKGRIENLNPENQNQAQPNSLGPTRDPLLPLLGRPSSFPARPAQHTARSSHRSSPASPACALGPSATAARASPFTPACLRAPPLPDSSVPRVSGSLRPRARRPADRLTPPVGPSLSFRNRRSRTGLRPRSPAAISPAFLIGTHT